MTKPCVVCWGTVYLHAIKVSSHRFLIIGKGEITFRFIIEGLLFVSSETTASL